MSPDDGVSVSPLAVPNTPLVMPSYPRHWVSQAALLKKVLHLYFQTPKSPTKTVLQTQTARGVKQLFRERNSPFGSKAQGRESGVRMGFQTLV